MELLSGVAAIVLLCQCNVVLCDKDDGPYFHIQHCYWWSRPSTLNCTGRGTNTIQILDVSLVGYAWKYCNSNWFSNSTEIQSSIRESPCHKEAMKSLHTVCSHKERCNITRDFLNNLHQCRFDYKFAWITYKCHQENNGVSKVEIINGSSNHNLFSNEKYRHQHKLKIPQAIILCKDDTVIEKPMCRSGTVIEIISASYADEVGSGSQECNCCSLFGDCLVKVSTETTAIIRGACEAKQTCSELQLNMNNQRMRCGEYDHNIDYIVIYYKCIVASETTPSPTHSTRSDVGGTYIGHQTSKVTEPVKVTMEITRSDTTTSTDMHGVTGKQNKDAQHGSTGLGVAVGVPVALLLLAAVVVVVIVVVTVRRRRQKHPVMVTSTGHAGAGDVASAVDNPVYVNQDGGVHFARGNGDRDDHMEAALENEYIVLAETMPPSINNHREHGPNNKAYNRPDLPGEVQPGKTMAQAANVQEDEDSCNPYELTVTDNQLYDFGDECEEKADQIKATKRGPLNDLYTLAEPRGGMVADTKKTEVEQTPLKKTDLGPVTGEIYSLPITDELEMLDNDTYAT